MGTLKRFSLVFAAATIVFLPLWAVVQVQESERCLRDANEVMGGGRLIATPSLTPEAHDFGTTVVAEYRIYVGSKNVILETLEIDEPDFAPYEIVGGPEVTQEELCDGVLIRWRAELQCLGQGCLPHQVPERFPATVLRYKYYQRVSKTGEVEVREQSTKLRWPQLTVRSLLTFEEVRDFEFLPGSYVEPKAPGHTWRVVFGHAVLWIAVLGWIAAMLVLFRRLLWRRDAVPAESEFDDAVSGDPLLELIQQAEEAFMQPVGLKRRRALHNVANILRKSDCGELRALRGAVEQAAHRMPFPEHEEAEPLLTEVREHLLRCTNGEEEQR